MKESPIYSNHTILSPNGEILCRASAKKTNWYLARQLAHIVQDNPRIIQLKFEPKGKGNAGDNFYLQNKEDVCVCCGDKQNLTMHHVVPRCFRKYFPESVKSHDSHDVIPLCRTCHSIYETQASKLKNEICHELNIAMLHSSISDTDREYNHIMGYINTLQKHRDRIPPERIIYLEKNIADYLRRNNLNRGSESFGKKVVKRIDNLQDFIVRWRRHFVSVMEPKYMPEGWQINKPIKGNI